MPTPTPVQAGATVAFNTDTDTAIPTGTGTPPAGTAFQPFASETPMPAATYATGGGGLQLFASQTPTPTAAGTAPATAAPTAMSTAQVQAAFGHLPVSFEPNVGQTDPGVAYLAHGSGYGLFLTGSAATLVLRHAPPPCAAGRPDPMHAMLPADPGCPQPSAIVQPVGQALGHSVAAARYRARAAAALASDSSSGTPSASPTPIPDTVVHIGLVGASAQATPAAQLQDQLPGKVNYLIGNDHAKWHTDIATYGRVSYPGVYPGVDMVYHGETGKLEYDFVVKPGADPAPIALRLSAERAPSAATTAPIGAAIALNIGTGIATVPFTSTLELDGGGAVVLHTSDGDVAQQPAVAYQQIGGQRQAVSVRYQLASDGQDGQVVRLALGNYDRSQPLVIDPVLVYATYLGGNASDGAAGIAVDSSGNAYVAGTTFSANFPIVPPSQTRGGIFISKLNPTGTALVYSTFLGEPSGSEDVRGLAVDAAGEAFVTGLTASATFPPSVNSYQSQLSGHYDAYVLKLAAPGNALLYATYLGGTLDDWGYAIAVDGSGSAYVTGYTESTNFPTANAYQPTLLGFRNAFVTKLSPSGSTLAYSTYLGGDGSMGRAIAVNPAGNAYVAGHTGTANFPTVNPLQTTGSMFATEFATNGRSLVYSTRLGGTIGDYAYSDCAYGIALDSTGNAYITGITVSTDFPTHNPAQGTYSGGFGDAFVLKLSAPGNALLYATYLGGGGYDAGNGIAVDGSGSAYVIGMTTSTNFPTANAIQSTFGGNTDVFVAKLAPTGSALAYSTYLGGSAGDGGAGIAVDATGNAYIAGGAGPGFPGINGFQTGIVGAPDAFIALLRGRS